MRFRKIIICIILFSMLIQTFSYATDSNNSISISDEQVSNLLYSPGSINISPTGGTASDIIVKMIFVPLITILNMPTIVTNVTDVAANVSDAVTIEGICFSKYSLLDINFFDFDANAKDGIDLMKKNISTWYKNLRHLSTACLLCVLLYIGIRMALSTTRER